MKFGAVPLAQAEGAILAHSAHLRDGPLRKGRMLTADDVARMAADGWADVVVAQLDAGDVAEDTAAARLGQALGTLGLKVTPAFTGRVNLKAQGPGIVVLDANAIHALNRVHPAITLATLPPFARVVAGSLVGTVKMIAYAVPEADLRRAEAFAAGALAVQPVVRQTASLLLTEVPGQDARLTVKGRQVMAGRLAGLGMSLVECTVTPHDETAMAGALAAMTGEVVLILTGSATSDLHDCAPQAVRRAGGTVARFGMPVDPGNLLFLGTIGARPVIGLPGCARSPALNGADWVLERIACGMDVTDDDIAHMGVGGLLKEIGIRPQLRDPG